jgi:hypothetical protein
MSTKSSALHCVTCNQALPEGREPEYFGQLSVGYEAETEVDRAAEDTHRFLGYAETVATATWDMIQVADANPPDLCEPEGYLDTARSLCTLLTDLVEETRRRVQTLSRLVDEKHKSEITRSVTGSSKH